MDESEYIALYKNYTKKHLPMTHNLEGLWVADFSSSTKDKGEYISDLRSYLDQLGKYVPVLTKAAQLRQQHYTLFIESKKKEDDGHKFWREGMNEIAKDAEEKLSYWTGVHTKTFSDYIEKYNRRKDPPVNVYTTKNVDYTEHSQKYDSVINRPKLTQDERNKRKKEKKLAKKIKEEQDDLFLNQQMKPKLEIDNYKSKLKINYTDKMIISFKKICKEYLLFSHKDAYIPSLSMLSDGNVYVNDSSMFSDTDCTNRCTFYLINLLTLQESNKKYVELRIKEIDVMVYCYQLKLDIISYYIHHLKTKYTYNEILNLRVNAIIEENGSFGLKTLFFRMVFNMAYTTNEAEMKYIITKYIKMSFDSDMLEYGLVAFSKVYDLWLRIRMDQRILIMDYMINDYNLTCLKKNKSQGRKKIIKTIATYKSCYPDFNIFERESFETIAYRKIKVFPLMGTPLKSKIDNFKQKSLFIEKILSETK